MDKFAPKEKSSVRGTLSWLSYEEKGLRMKANNPTSVQSEILCRPSWTILKAAERIGVEDTREAMSNALGLSDIMGENPYLPPNSQRRFDVKEDLKEKLEAVFERFDSHHSAYGISREEAIAEIAKIVVESFHKHKKDDESEKFVRGYDEGHNWCLDELIEDWSNTKDVP